MVRLLARFDETSPVRVLGFNAILDDYEHRRFRSQQWKHFFEPRDLIRDEQALVALFAQQRERLFRRQFGAERQLERDENILFRPTLRNLRPYRLWIILLHRFAAAFAMKLINPLLLGGLKKYRSIAALTVAKAMFKQSLKAKKGVYVYTTQQIKERA